MMMTVKNSDEIVHGIFTQKDYFNPKANLPMHSIDARFIDITDYLYHYCLIHGWRLVIYSTYRNYGSVTSSHRDGYAIDYHIYDSNGKRVEMRKVYGDDELFDDLFELGARGFGYYDWGLHIDVHDNKPRRWRKSDTGEIYGIWSQITESKTVVNNFPDAIEIQDDVTNLNEVVTTSIFLLVITALISWIFDF